MPHPSPVRLARVHADVLRWYAVHARPLPWRAPGTSPWGVYVSEIMAQQTPVARVEPVWREWLTRWPTPADLAAATPGDAVRAWGRLGYPRRALRLHDAARVMVDRHDGQVPKELTDLLALPGVGAYTAAAVACFAHGIPEAVVDTNVRRVLARAITGTALAAPTLTAAETALAVAALPADHDDALTWNVAVMELGALVCTARAPRCEVCPIRSECAWQLAGAPPDAGPARRGQAWVGTDRQARGALLQALRDAPGTVRSMTLEAVWPDPIQRARCLDGLVADGLVEPLAGQRFRLPGWPLAPDRQATIG
ncbi:MAG TPA: A/G-specific adenine glycosylase [Dermatophilaceae bacterium]|nr:A/G-specific adenine glycosylase [Dermatophilaceae bacterium]